MPEIEEIYTPKRMDRMVQMIKPAPTFLIDTFFKDQTPYHEKKVVIDFVKDGQPMAAFVHPKRPAEIEENDGYETKEFEAPMLAPTRVINEDRISLRKAGENPYAAVTPARRAAQYAMEDYRKSMDSIKRRMEWMAAQAIFGGKIPVKGEGINEEIDFKLDNKEVLDETKWDSAESDPAKDIFRWKEAVQTASGRDANILVCSADVMHAYINHPSNKERLDIRRYELGSISPRIVSPHLIYFGTDRLSEVDLYCYTGKYTDAFTDPSEIKTNVPYVPAGSLALLPRDGDFRTFYGAITYIPYGSKNFVTKESQYVANIFVKNNPDRYFSQILSRPLPAPIEINSWFTAKVL